MSATNRAGLFAKIHKVLKKHYEPAAPPSDRTVLEHLLYACVLENAKHDHVDDVFAKLQKSFFDWNEIRVTSGPELAEVMAVIPDAAEAAKRLKRALQSVFETFYQFDLEPLRKAGLGKALESVGKFSGVSPFVVDYMAQNALGGHAIPTSGNCLKLLVVLGAVSDQDAAKNRVPGLERAIPKSKGVEFASLLHHFAIDFAANPQSSRVKAIVSEVDPTAKERLPKKVATQPSKEVKPAVTKKTAMPMKPPEPAPKPNDRGKSETKSSSSKFSSGTSKSAPKSKPDARMKPTSGITRKKPK